VQSAVAAATGASLTATFGTAPTAGNRILAFGNSDATLTIASAGGTWTERIPSGGYVNDQGAYIWELTSGTLPTSVTVTPSASDYASLSIVEVTGTSAFDVISTVAEVHTNTATATASTVTTTGTNGDLVFCWIAWHGDTGAGTWPTSPVYGNSLTGLTAPNPGVTGSATTGHFLGYKVQSSAGAVGATTVTWTNTAQNYAAYHIGFTNTAGGGGGGTATPGPNNFTMAAVQRASSW
jgi:hypothetical protein